MFHKNNDVTTFICKTISSYNISSPLDEYDSQPIKGQTLAQEIRALEKKRGIKPAPLPLEGFYSHLFVVKKASGTWRLIIDLSPLSKYMYILKSRFKMETEETPLRSIKPGNWFLTLDLRRILAGSDPSR